MLGVAIGDALGKPVENFSEQEIKARFGRIERYESPADHRWFKGHQPGTGTDDTSLTLEICWSLAKNGRFDRNSILEAHKRAYNRGKAGWGPSTREATVAYINGVDPDHFFQDNPNWAARRGLGNGVAMKIAPIASMFAYLQTEPEVSDAILLQISDLTHRTRTAHASAVIHSEALRFCLRTAPSSFSPVEFHQNLVDSCRRILGPNPADCREALLLNRLERLAEVREDARSAALGAGGSVVSESLPMVYWHFMQSQDIRSLFNVVNLGGDTDTNAALLGSLLGALSGPSVFPDTLKEGLTRLRDVVRASEALSSTFRGA